MHRLLSFCIGLFLVFQPFAATEEARVPSMNDKGDTPNTEALKAKKEMSIDDLLGPKDNFPFLPDNHRDSGTGKFNSF